MRRAYWTVPGGLLLVGCAPPMKRTDGPVAQKMSELWLDPGDRVRDLSAGPPTLSRTRPQTDARYVPRIRQKIEEGFSLP